jgi:hypothetical protein
MIPLIGSAKTVVTERMRPLLDITEYHALHTLSCEAFLEKYGHWGFRFGDALEIRFPKGTDVLEQMAKLLDPAADYFFFPIHSAEAVFMGTWEQIHHYCSNSPGIEHFILADQALEWALEKDPFRKLIGIGETIKEKITTKINSNPRLRFDDTEIMYQMTRKKER